MFAAGERQWRARLGTLRQVARQEMVARQLRAHLPPAACVLDVGCGQGTQALRLARTGHQVTGLDSSPALLHDFEHALAAGPPEVRERVRLVHGDANEASGDFDVVLCHGVLMYFRRPRPGASRARRRGRSRRGRVAPGAQRRRARQRPGLLGDWATAAAAFDGDGMTYRNRIGVTARADRLADLTERLGAHRLAVRAWYGVRVFTDTADGDAALPPDLDALLDCEERAGAADPYRRVAALTHVIAERRA